MSHTARIQVADSEAEVHYHLDEHGHVIVERVVNLDSHIAINCTTMEGSAFDRLAADCAAAIRGEARKAA
jgi:hypothetical protein